MFRRCGSVKTGEEKDDLVTEPHIQQRLCLKSSPWFRPGLLLETILEKGLIQNCKAYQTTNKKYPQLGILSPIGDTKSPVGDNIPNYGLGTSEPESENQSANSNWVKYTIGYPIN